MILNTKKEEKETVLYSILFMKNTLLTLAFIIGSINLLLSQVSDATPQVSELTIGEQMSFHSKILNEKRSFNIYLPYSYSREQHKTYPVIYLLDGSLDEDFLHISGIVQFGSFSWINMVPESIVVGISNIDRKKDFTFPSNNKLDQEDFPTAGKSGDFMNFLQEEVFKIIEAHYRISSERTLIGQSLGGLLATEILFKRPEMFDNYIIVSPSLWWDDDSLLNYQPEALTSKKSVYIGVGEEGEYMKRIAEELYEKINVPNSRKADVYYRFFKERDHGDALHVAVYDAFEKIFKSDQD